MYNHTAVMGSWDGSDGPGSNSDREISLFYKTYGPPLGPKQWALVSFSGVNMQRRDVDHSPVFSAKVKNEWSYAAAPPVCLHSVDRGTFF
jgi:hypothetical protein